MAAQEVAKNLDELIQEMLKRARLALQQPDAYTPLQRSCARSLIETHNRAQQHRTSYDDAKEARRLARKEARKAQADRNFYARPDDVGSKVIRFFGVKSERDRKADDAAKTYSDARNAATAAKTRREHERETWTRATREAEQAREAFGTAFDLPIPRFEKRPESQPEQRPESTPLTQPRVSTGGPTPPKPPGMR